MIKLNRNIASVRLENKMAKGNDAIPSWSGFNYQGKMTILCVLEEINSGIANGNYKVSLEKIEDYAIFRDDGVGIKLFQVKAKLGDTKRNCYIKYKDKNGKTIAEKLLQHKSEKNCGSAECYLVAAVDIVDWEVDGNSYIDTIKLYKRSGKAVGLKEVRTEIEKEIITFLTKKGIQLPDKKIIENIYLNLCNMIDEKVSQIHEAEKKKKDYCILFGDIENEIHKTLKTQETEQETYLKEKVYEFITDKMVEAYNTYLSIEKNMPVDDDSVKQYMDMVLCEENIEEFIRSLNPGDKDWNNCLSYANNIVEEKIVTMLYEVIAASFCGDSIVHQHGVYFFNSNIKRLPYREVVPTLMELKKSVISGDQLISRKIDNIKNNYELKPYISEKTLLYDGSDLPYDTLWKNSIMYTDKKQDSENTINEIYKDIGLINKDRYLEELKDDSSRE